MKRQGPAKKQIKRLCLYSLLRKGKKGSKSRIIKNNLGATPSLSKH
jgi:hypothetical protein